MNRTKVWSAISLLLVASIVAFLYMRYRILTELRKENLSLRYQAEQLADLRAENDRLASRSQWAALAPLSSEESRELLRLRGEVGPLRSQLAEAGGVTAAQDRWSYAGADTPEALMETFLWALANTNFNQATGAIHVEISGPSSPFTTKVAQDNFEAEIRWEMMGRWITNLDSLEIISANPVGNEELMVKLWQTTFDGNKRPVFARARRVDNQWKFVSKWVVLELNRAGSPTRMRISLPFVNEEASP